MSIESRTTSPIVFRFAEISSSAATVLAPCTAGRKRAPVPSYQRISVQERERESNRDYSGCLYLEFADNFSAIATMQSSVG